MKIKITIILILLLVKATFSQVDTSKFKINYGISLSGLAFASFDKTTPYYKNDAENYPVFYNLAFYLSKKRHSFEIGIANQFININPDNFAYSLSYSYRLTKPNKIADISVTIKTLSFLYQIQNPAKEIKQSNYNDMGICFGPSISKRIKRLIFHLNLFCVSEQSYCISQSKNNSGLSFNAGKFQHLKNTFITELKISYRLNN